MKRNNLILLGIIVIGAILRVCFLVINFENKNNYFGHSLNAADMGMQFVFHKKIGVFNPEHADILHSAAISANKLIDPQDLNFKPSPHDKLVPDFQNEIGLGLLMGIIWSLTKDMRFIYIQILQLLIDVFCIFIIYLTALNIFNISEIALISAFLYALFPLQIYLVTFPSPYPWMVFGTVFILYILSKIYGNLKVRIPECKKTILFMFIGLLSGLFAYIRSTILYLPIFIAFSLLLEEKKVKVIKYTLSMILIEFIILSPLIIRNYQAFGKIMVMRGNFWHTMWGGFGGHNNPWGVRYSDNQVAQSVLEENPNIEVYGPEYEEILKKRWFKSIKERPVWVIKMYLERVLRFLFPVSWTADGRPYFSYKKTLAVLPIFIFGFWGAYLVVSKKFLTLKKLLIFLSPTLYFFITTLIVTSPQIKYVYQGYIFLIILIAFPIWYMYKKFIKKSIFDGLYNL